MLNVIVGGAYVVSHRNDKRICVVTGSPAGDMFPVMFLSGTVGEMATIERSAFLSERKVDVKTGGGTAVLKEKREELLNRYSDKLCWWDVSELDTAALESVEKKLENGTYKRTAHVTDGERNIPRGKYLCIDGIPQSALDEFLRLQGFTQVVTNSVQKREKTAE